MSRPCKAELDEAKRVNRDVRASAAAGIARRRDASFEGGDQNTDETVGWARNKHQREGRGPASDLESGSRSLKEELKDRPVGGR